MYNTEIRYDVDELDSLTYDQLRTVYSATLVKDPRSSSGKPFSRGMMISELTENSDDKLQTDVLSDEDELARALIENIRVGGLDKYIREIAKACVDRKHELDGQQDFIAKKKVIEFLNAANEASQYTGIIVQTKIQAIKMYRDICKCGLREAKEIVEDMIANMGYDRT